MEITNKEIKNMLNKHRKEINIVKNEISKIAKEIKEMIEIMKNT